MIRTTVIYVVNSPVLFFGCFFLLRASLWTVFEKLWYARAVPYRQVAAKDFGAELFHVFFVIPIVLFLYDQFSSTSHPLPQALQNIRLSVRIALYIVITDFGYYWIHRIMHQELLWRAHKWHHSPTYMYWLAGCRATIPQQFLVGVPYVLAAPILYPAPWWIYTALIVFDYLAVDWMHLNVRLGARWIEWIFVTPRYHNIHHSSNPDHYNANFGNLFTVWDRLFGTYVDPATSDPEAIAFGIGEKPNPVRLIAGI
jgi:sterol desaturase/sphingolipid hydroxylase (fatty acid hydroxylase superfamily)